MNETSRKNRVTNEESNEEIFGYGLCYALTVGTTQKYRSGYHKLVGFLCHTINKNQFSFHFFVFLEQSDASFLLHNLL